MTIEKVAQVAYEVNRAYCMAMGDNSFLSWEEAPEWQKNTNIIGVRFKLDNPDASPEALHESWLEQKKLDGWKYGPVKNAETKEHPCFLPYAELPTEQKTKDYLFKAVVESLRPQIKTPSKELTRGQQVMSVSFNPGQREDVAAIEQSFADTFDEIDKWVEKAQTANSVNMDMKVLQEKSGDIKRLAAIAKTNLETAQMYAVKAVTR